MRLVIDEYHLVLNNRKPICMRVPGTVTLTIKNKDNADHIIAKGDVTVTQKEDSPLSISGSNSEERLELIINVAGNPEGADEAAFLITVKDVGVLDPKVRVIDTDVLNMMLTRALEDLVDALGVAWTDVARIAEMKIGRTD